MGKNKEENKVELEKVMTIPEENEKIEKQELKNDEIKDENEKVKDIVKKAKENGKITYGELAKELEDTNPDQIDKVFDAFEEMGVNLLNDDFE